MPAALQEDKDTVQWTANNRKKDRPDFGTMEQTFCVHDGCEDGLHLELSDIVTMPESWGRYLSHIAWLIARALEEYHDGEFTQEEALALIRRAFNEDDALFEGELKEAPIEPPTQAR
jgi:hypothetical protein